MREWAEVPTHGVPQRYEEYTFEVPSKPPRIAYLLAVMAPEGPCALLKPNSTHYLPLAIIFILAALVLTRDEKLVKFNKGVSISYRRANGPSICINGCS